MTTRLGWRLFAGRWIAVACFCAIPAGKAVAQQSDLGSAIAGGFFQLMQNAATAKTWKRVDQPTQTCLASQYNLNVNSLVAQGILPSDPRISPDIQACQSTAISGQTQQASVEPQSEPIPPKPARDELVREFGSKHADLILAGQIAKGMNEDEVTLAWGNPSDKSTSRSGRQVWNYGSDIVTFTNRRVSAVGH